MAKPTNQESYQYGEHRIIPMPYFLYEITIYRISNNIAAIINSKFFKSKKLLKFKKEIERIQHKNYYTIKSIDMLGAPIDFIKENKLPLYTLKKKKH